MDAFFIGIQTVMQLDSMLFILFGVAWGTLGGMIPGINATIAMALLLPFTWGMEPAVAIMMLAGVYCGGEYGGSIPAVLIGTPGTNAAACTVYDGYELHKKGKTGLALYTSLNSSVFGGLFGTVCLILLAVPLAGVALAFGPAEYFALAFLGLSMICSLGENNVLKGVLAGLLGILLATVGFDPIAGVPRYTFGFVAMTEGFDMVPLMMGFYAISEMFKQAQEVMAGESFKLKMKTDTRLPKISEVKHLWPYDLYGSIVGTIVGVMPGAGATVAAFLSYSGIKRISKDPDSFGKGNLIGVAVPEAANNGATGGAMVPLLALGIPGSNSTAIMLSALMIHNIIPGPMLFVKTPEVPYGLFAAMVAANILMWFVGALFIKFAIKITDISKQALVAVIIALVFTGVYAYSLDMFSVSVTLAFGLFGMVMRRFDLPHTATVLGFVLGFIMEANLRRALIISDGSLGGAFFNSTLSSILLFVAVSSVLVSFIKGIQRSKANKETMCA